MKSILIALIIALGLASLALGYTYPKGIPTAWMEPDAAAPAKPDPWTSETPGFYYVNASTGTDSGRTYGTPTAPRATLPTLSAGRYVEVEGDYDLGVGSKFVTFSGDSGSWVADTSGPCWLVSKSGVALGGAIYWLGSYGIVDGFTNKLRNEGWNVSSTTYSAARYASNLLFRNIELEGDGASTGPAFPVNGNSWAVTGQTRNIIIYNSEIHNWGPQGIPDGTQDLDNVAIIATDYVTGLWVLDNHIHHMGGQAMQCTARTDANYKTFDIFAGRNDCHHLVGTGMASKGASHVVYSQNKIDTVYDNGGYSPGKCIGIQYYAANVWLIENELSNSVYGILRVSGGGGPTYILGNYIHDIISTRLTGGFIENSSGDAAIGIWGGNPLYIIGNTIINASAGIIGPTVQTTIIENNIIGTLNQPTGKHLYFEISGTKVLEVNNNLFYQSGRDVIVTIPGETSGNVANLNGFAYATGNIESAPVHGTAPGLDAGSPAINAGVDAGDLYLDVYAKYLTDYGIDISTDYYGGIRPEGASQDIGTAEYGAEIPDASAPVFTVNPTISGTATEGETLTGNRGIITGVPSPAYYYQWIRCDAGGSTPVDIVGATSTTYTLAIADVGKTIRFKVTATNSGGSANQTSSQTGVVVGTTVTAPTFSPENHITFPAPTP